VVTKDKAPERTGKVQLIDASKCCEKRRKSLGNKRNEFTDRCISLISKAYLAFENGTYEDGELVVESKVKDCDDFKFTKVAIKLPNKGKWMKLPRTLEFKVKP
jgi:type I restriction enzyme M protein